MCSFTLAVTPRNPIKNCVSKTLLQLIVTLKQHPLEREPIRDLLPSIARVSFMLKRPCRFSHFMEQSSDLQFHYSAADQRNVV